MDQRVMSGTALPCPSQYEEQKHFFGTAGG
jgi:hypothetical protein